MKAKVANVQATVSTGVTSVGSSVSSISSVKGGEILSKVQQNVSTAANQAAEKVNKM